MDLLTHSSESAESISYKLEAPAVIATTQNTNPTIKVCLSPGLRCTVGLVGKYVSDNEFKAVDSDEIVKCESLDAAVKLEEVQAYDCYAHPLIKEVRVKILSDMHQIDQAQQKVVIEKIARKSIEVDKEIVGVIDLENGVVVYTINETIDLSRSLMYSLIPEIEVEIEVVY